MTTERAQERFQTGPEGVVVIPARGQPHRADGQAPHGIRRGGYRWPEPACSSKSIAVRRVPPAGQGQPGTRPARRDRRALTARMPRDGFTQFSNASISKPRGLSDGIAFTLLQFRQQGFFPVSRQIV